MIRYFYILSFLFVSLALLAQQDSQPQRTAADIALKQTEMLVRELGITDSVLHETLYLMHLKYAKLRELSNTRQEAIQRMQQMQDELKNILSPEQFIIFINRQMETRPRFPHSSCNRIIPSPHQTLPPPPPHGEDDMPPLPPEHQPQDHQ